MTPELRARMGHDVGDVCDLIMANALRAPRARPSDRANSSVVSPLRASPDFRKEEEK